MTAAATTAASKVALVLTGDCSLQVWRPIAGHVQDSPLGMVDATTVSAEDLVPTPIHLASGHQHEIHFVAHNPNHK